MGTFHRASLCAALSATLVFTAACAPPRTDSSIDAVSASQARARPSPPIAPPKPAPTPAFQYVYNQNALIASRLVGDHLIAIVQAGHVLRFDADSLELTGELLSNTAAHVLGAVSGEELSVGFEDGRIARLNAETLYQEAIGRVEGVPLWVSQGPEETVVVHAKLGHKASPAHRRPYKWPYLLTDYRATWLDSRREVAVLADAGTFLDAGNERLWLGRVGQHARLGEVQVIDLRNAVAAYKGLLPGAFVGGLSKLPDGSVATYSIKETFRPPSRITGARKARCDRSPYEQQTFIARLRERAPHKGLFTSKPFRDPNCADSLPGTGDRPEEAILAAESDPSDGSVIVVSMTGVFRADARFAAWKKLGSFGSLSPRQLDRSRLLLPDIHLRNSSLIIATLRDGYQRVDLATGVTESHRIGGLLEVNPIMIRAARDEALLMETFWHEHQVALSASGFLPVARLQQAPPPRTLRGRRYDNQGWRSHNYLPAPDGTLFIVSEWGDTENWSANANEERPTVVALRESGVSRVLGEQSTKHALNWMFVAPDGLLLANEDRAARLWVFDGGQWTGFDNNPRPTVIKDLGRYRSEWFVLVNNLDGHGLRLATYRRGARSLPEVQLLPDAGWRAEPERPNTPSGLTDAVRWDAEHLLIVGESGLCLYDLRSRRCPQLPLQQSIQATPTHAIRDADGRVWLAGNGFWLLEALDRVRAFHEQIPILRHARVFDCALFQRDLLLALGDRGLVRVDVDGLSDSRAIHGHSARPSAAP